MNLHGEIHIAQLEELTRTQHQFSALRIKYWNDASTVFAFILEQLELSELLDVRIDNFDTDGGLIRITMSPKVENMPHKQFMEIANRFMEHITKR